MNEGGEDKSVFTVHKSHFNVRETPSCTLKALIFWIFPPRYHLDSSVPQGTGGRVGWKNKQGNVHSISGVRMQHGMKRMYSASLFFIKCFSPKSTSLRTADKIHLCLQRNTSE